MDTATEPEGRQATPEELLAAAADALEELDGERPARALEHVDAAMAALHVGP